MCLWGADLHEGAVEEGPLGNDEVGAEAAGDGLLCGAQLLLGELQAAIQLVQVPPETWQVHGSITGRRPDTWFLGQRGCGANSSLPSLPSSLSGDRKE